MQRNIAAAAVDLAEIAAHHEVIVTHGNGPQIGLLALQAEAYPEVPPYPLDVLGAESEGMIGYLIERELANHLSGREICSLLTRVVVDPQVTHDRETETFVRLALEPQIETRFGGVVQRAAREREVAGVGAGIQAARIKGDGWLNRGYG